MYADGTVLLANNAERLLKGFKFKKKIYDSLYSASGWRTIRCAVHMSHIAVMFKVHGALQFIVI